MPDQLHRYLLQDHGVRAMAVHIDEAWQTGLAHQPYPPQVRRLLGELVAAAVLLAANLKFRGALVLQLQGDGPVSLMVVECNADLSIRATAKLRESGPPLAQDDSLQALLNPGGQGRFVVILDPQNQEAGMRPYQGVVPLEGETVAEVLQNYMHTSEQLETRLWLAADGQCCAGLLLQKLPASAEAPAGSPESWDHVLALAGTVQSPELLALDSTTLAHRLFWNETLAVYPPQTVRWWCPCTRERVADMLRMLGRDEVDSILAEQAKVDVSCNFCGKPYRFDAIDCARLFIAAQDTPPVRPLVN